MTNKMMMIIIIIIIIINAFYKHMPLGHTLLNQFRKIFIEK